MEGFCRQEGGEEVISERKEENASGKIFFPEEEEQRDIITQIASTSFWGMERAHVTYYLIGASWKIPDRLRPHVWGG